MDDEQLMERAREMRDDAYVPYSDYRVGAALLCADGSVYTGCNIENANFSNSLHAEEVALGPAVRDGHREFEAIAVSSSDEIGLTPCGMCRQSLFEFCDEEFRILADEDGEIVEHVLGELLPVQGVPDL